MENLLLTPEQIEKIVVSHAKRRGQINEWRKTHRETVLSYQKAYNAKYMEAMKDQTVHCPCCCRDVKKVSYANHLKTKKHLAKLTPNEL